MARGDGRIVIGAGPASDTATVHRSAVCAVVVTWQPDLGVLRELLDALSPQVGHMVVVDNGTRDPEFREACAARSDIVLIALGGNHGLAHAINRGTDRARGLPGVSHVLLMDQDSVPDGGMVDALRSALGRAGAHTRPAAVGPRFRDPREPEDAPFVRIRFPFNEKVRCDGGCETVRCDFLISSGCLIPLAVLDDVGGMGDALFIDNVDLDWCFRASAAGYALHGVCAAHLRHRLGETRRYMPGMPRGIVVHSPGRLFYMMRNRVLLYRRAYTPRRWIAQDVPRLIVKFLLFALLVAPRRKNVRCMLAGLWAGVHGRTPPPPGGA
jgi:rhamnosyltransferase